MSGCGDNRWLFSCCIKKQTPIKIHIKNNHQNVMKKSILKRRTDERLSDCGIPSKANTKIQKRIIGGRPGF